MWYTITEDSMKPVRLRYSRMTQLWGCPQADYYQYGLGIDYADAPSYFKVGNVIDKLMQVYAEDGLDAAIAAIGFEWETTEEDLDQRQYDHLVNALTDVDQKYGHIFAGVKGTQVQLEREVRGLDGKPLDPPCVFTGIPDVIGAEEELGEYILDVKSTRYDVSPTASIWDRYLESLQLVGYNHLMENPNNTVLLYLCIKWTPPPKKPRTEQVAVQMMEVPFNPSRYRLFHQYLLDSYEAAKRTQAGDHPRNLNNCTGVGKARCKFYELCHGTATPENLPTYLGVHDE